VSANTPMNERRYTEEEVAAIFERASEVSQAGPRQTSLAEGMTLAELQDIGREVGIPAESIALAAQTLGQSGQAASRTFMGLPLGVARTVYLGRRLSDAEWERLVVDLRDTFNARGIVKTQGSLRQWTNGNLQVLLEPTATGDRLRLRTVKGGALGAVVGGILLVGLSAAGLIGAAAQGLLGDATLLSTMGLSALAGAGIVASNAVRLPRWGRTRQQQMDEIAARIALATTSSTEPPRSLP
jgi:hypothetical protein